VVLRSGADHWKGRIQWFIESFSERVSEVVLFAPTRSERHRSKNGSRRDGVYGISSGVRVVPLPFYENTFDVYRRVLNIVPATVAQSWGEIGRCDVLWIIQPHPLIAYFLAIAEILGVPYFLQVRGNILADIGRRYTGLKYLMGKVVALTSHWSNLFALRKNPGFVVGVELVRLYARKGTKPANISPSLISEKMITESRIRLKKTIHLPGRVVRVLFVGRVEPEKGLRYLFDAIGILENERPENFKLAVVGEAQRGGEGKEEALKRLASSAGRSALIEFKGYIPFGSELFSEYLKSDVFVLPSLSEGIPKVIFEAMAFGVPVITTDVGGITGVVVDHFSGLIIDKESARSIANAVAEVLDNTALRTRLVYNALNTVSGRTLENARNRILAEMIGLAAI